ncbi:hypothetical protein OAO01_02900 [Oligoflexia bacterium]|nr:hypothetical protein [Oligoflexia bacterium]
MFLTLIKPNLYAIKNRWKSCACLRRQVGRDLISLIFALIVICVMYNTTAAILENLYFDSRSPYSPHSILLHFLTLVLFMILLFTNCVVTLNTLFVAKDLDLILSSPIGKLSFFSGRYLNIFLNSSWMALLFAGPTIFAFGTYYGYGQGSSVLALFVLLVFFTIPASIAIVVVTLCTSLVSISRLKELLFLMFVLLVGCTYYVFKLIGPIKLSYGNINQALEALLASPLLFSNWMPPHWTANTITALLLPTETYATPFLIALVGTSFCLFMLAYTCVSCLHAYTYSASKDAGRQVKLRSQKFQYLLKRWSACINQQYRAFIVKEFRLFARDMSQALQLVFLLSICIVYLYNFQILDIIREQPAAIAALWRSLLLVGNITMGAFVMIAICGRFVFPSVSMEGRNFWILQKAPIGVLQVMHAKFWFWFFPIAIMSSVIFGSAALAVQAQMSIIISCILCSWVLSYGIVGMGIGLGAFFLNLRWEHPSQLTASFGVLAYLLSCTGLLFLSLLATTVVMLLQLMEALGHSFPDLLWYVAIGLGGLALVFINYISTKIALKLGRSMLDETFV